MRGFIAKGSATSRTALVPQSPDPTSNIPVPISSKRERLHLSSYQALSLLNEGSNSPDFIGL